MRDFWVSFITLFVAVDAIGTLPIYMSLVQNVEKKKLRRILLTSVVTALIVGHFFLLIGNRLLKVLGISIADFMVAGGIILFLLTLSELLSYEKKPQGDTDADIGPVPLGVPLIVGPAVITTAMLLLGSHGLASTSVALSLNCIIAGALFSVSSYISRLLGKTGEKIISKLAALLLAAYGVMMVRKGIMLFLQ
ncbi:MAG: MarC family protein [Chitinivibrionales bacterium]|nr:MarC family protein [Chitinivibrionales bacterium]